MEFRHSCHNKHAIAASLLLRSLSGRYGDWRMVFVDSPGRSSVTTIYGARIMTGSVRKHFCAVLKRITAGYTSSCSSGSMMLTPALLPAYRCPEQWQNIAGLYSDIENICWGWQEYLPWVEIAAHLTLNTGFMALRRTARIGKVGLILACWET